jgi:small subunit ribosomal protein S4
MGRYVGASCRLCRREMTKLFLKGTRCETSKCAVEQRNYPPGGQSRQRFRKKLSDYGLQLREKQKAKRTYGILETQFRNYFRIAAKRRGVTGENLLKLLEMRLDNVVYRSGFAASRAAARQLVGHGHVAVNGKRVSMPAYQVQENNEVSVVEKSKKMTTIEQAIEAASLKGFPEWLEVDVEERRARVKRSPYRDEIPSVVQEQLIVELYSK